MHFDHHPVAVGLDGTPDVRNGSIVLKKSKIERRQKSRKCQFLDDSVAQMPVVPIRSSMVVFRRSDVVPRIATQETQQQFL